MILINHRTNTIDGLIKTDSQHGVEVDVRSWCGELILQHDPFKSGVGIEQWLSHYNHKFLIVNVKEADLGGALIKLFKKYEINEYAFLDQTFPEIYLSKHDIERRFKSFLRISEYECIETVEASVGFCRHVWIDFFEGIWECSSHLKLLKEKGFFTCLVAPELQYRCSVRDQDDALCFVRANREAISSICTKNIKWWESEL